jgi:putative transposase
MPNYRRSRVAGGTLFFTVVTYGRLPILANPRSVEILREAWENTNERFPFKTDAVCFLPEHIHAIWTLPEGDSDYSKRWSEIKRLFSIKYSKETGLTVPINESRRKRGESAIWQRRFWEHTIKDERDLKCHVEYIHYNPVKHGHVLRTADWKWSSFHNFVEKGLYPKDWADTVNFSNP